MTQQESEKLILENNIMLRSICAYLIKSESRSDLKNFMANLVADLYVDKLR